MLPRSSSAEIDHYHRGNIRWFTSRDWTTEHQLVIESLIRPHVMPRGLEAAYQSMAQDEDHEAEALAWIKGTLEEVTETMHVQSTTR